MSAAAPTPVLPLADRMSDWLNPILIKETRQALKSRQFIGTFFLMLVSAWLISVFGVVLAGPGITYQDRGREFFSAYYVVLAIAIFVAVPFGAFRSLLVERDLHTWEVLSITTLKPRQIVWGKLTSAVVQLFIYYSAITPFIAFANLLKGIDVPTIVFVLVASMFWSLALSMVALAVSTFGGQRYSQVFLTLAILAGLLISTFSSIVSVIGGTQTRFPFDEPGFWWVVGVLVSYVVAYCVLFLQIAVAQLTFDADNKSSGIRLAAAGIFWLSVAWIVAALILDGRWGMSAFPTGDIDEILITITTIAGLHWFVVGLFVATESDALSRRVRRDVQRFGVWRVFTAPFIPGGSRGLLYLIGHISILFALIVCASLALGITSMHPNVLPYAAGVWCYVVIYIGFGAVLGRAARAVSGDFRPSHTRVLTVLLVALASILPLTFYFFDAVRNAPKRNALLFVTDPISTLYALAENDVQTSMILLILAMAALVSLLLNLRAMLAGVSDIARAYVPPAPSAPRPPVVQ
jgi:hypothetical protein